MDNSRNETMKGTFERNTLAVDLGASDKSSRAEKIKMFISCRERD